MRIVCSTDATRPRAREHGARGRDRAARMGGAADVVNTLPLDSVLRGRRALRRRASRAVRRLPALGGAERAALRRPDRGDPEPGDRERPRPLNLAASCSARRELRRGRELLRREPDRRDARQPGDFVAIDASRSRSPRSAAEAAAASRAERARRFGGHATIEGDAFELEGDGSAARVGVYYYDGPHDHASQVRGMRDRAVAGRRGAVVLDDHDWAEVRTDRRLPRGPARRGAVDIPERRAACVVGRRRRPRLARLGAGARGPGPRPSTRRGRTSAIRGAPRRRADRCAVRRRRGGRCRSRSRPRRGSAPGSASAPRPGAARRGRCSA